MDNHLHFIETIFSDASKFLDPKEGIEIVKSFGKEAYSIVFSPPVKEKEHAFLLEITFLLNKFRSMGWRSSYQFHEALNQSELRIEIV